MFIRSDQSIGSYNLMIHKSRPGRSVPANPPRSIVGPLDISTAHQFSQSKRIAAFGLCLSDPAAAAQGEGAASFPSGLDDPPHRRSRRLPRRQPLHRHHPPEGRDDAGGISETVQQGTGGAAVNWRRIVSGIAKQTEVISHEAESMYNER